MRVRVRHMALLVIIASLAGCKAGTSAAASSSAAAPASASPSATTTPTASQGPLGVLAVPAGATPWKANTNALMSRTAFVKTFYITSAQSNEDGQYLRRGFVSGVIEGWINADGSQQSIAIARFATAAGATSAFDDLRGAFKGQAKPVTMLSDPAIAGSIGMQNPTLDSLGNAQVQFAATVGDEMLVVHEFTAATPDQADAKALFQKQYDALKNGS